MPIVRKYMDFEKTWSVLKETVKKIIANDVISRDAWNEGFNNVYSLCVALPISQVDQLYLETKILLNEHVKHLLLKLKIQDKGKFILDYYNAWRNFSQGMHHLHCMYLHLNTANLKRKKDNSNIMIRESYPTRDYPENMEIEEMCLAIWKKQMIEPLKTVLASLFLVCLHAERTGKDLPANKEIISELIQSTMKVNKYNIFNQQDLYEELVEQTYLVDIHKVYTLEITALNREQDLDFMETLMWRLNSDEFKTHIFLQNSSLMLIKQIYKDIIINTHLDWLLMKADDMIKHERREDLALLYSLLKELGDNLDSFTSKFSQHVTDKGLEAISLLQEENVHVQFVENIMEVYTKYSEFVKDIFKSDVSFFNALENSWKVIMNFNSTLEQPIKAPELLAKYCDSFLRKSVKTTSQDKIEKKIDKANLIFKYIEDKDDFRKFYARLLLRRFIQQQLHSMDAEESMISHFKESCGYEFTLMLHQIFKDMSITEDLNIEFVDYLQKNERNSPFGINFSVYLIRKDVWQFGVECMDSFLIPRQVALSIGTFENFYQTKFSDRKLIWLPSLCQGELRLNYLKKSYLVNIHTYQMAILLLFEECDSIRCKDAAEALKLSCDQLIRHAASLVECNILNKNTEGELEDNTLLSLNFDYHNKRTKFIIKTAPQKEGQQTAQDTQNNPVIDQNQYLQTVIVRIMKNCKLLKYQQLEQEILNVPKIRFLPSTEMIKKSIESLVEKEYLEKIENEGCEYSYIA